MATTLKSQADVHGIKAPATGEIVCFDEGPARVRVSGLALRIRAAGSRRFVFHYRIAGKGKRVTIGDASSWTLDQARGAARKFRVQADTLEDPAAMKAGKRAALALTFGHVKEDFLAFRRKQNLAASYLRDNEMHLNQHWADLHDLPILSIDRAIVSTATRDIVAKRGMYAADRARATLSAFFSWAIGEGICDINPVMGTNRAGPIVSRDRVLTDDELAAIWNGVRENDYGKIVRLLMLTGQRRDEIGSLSRGELTLDGDAPLISLPGSRTKNGRAHDVPLSGMAVDILKAVEDGGRQFLFGSGQGGYSGWSKSKAALDASVPLADWHMHDIRRTVATRMADIGILPHVIEAIQNHVSGHKAGVAGIYNRGTYAAERREALGRWATYIGVLLAKAGGANVTPLRVRA